ncbi:MAG: hypothetical protein N2322_05225, partial [Terrimicrobiaceae bacterium]|nr:hypothetical protein [Terrimicrobiaceae bacterium]
MSPPRAVIFDLDDTLIVDEEITRGAFLEAGKAAAASHPGLDIATFAASARPLTMCPDGDRGCSFSSASALARALS